jgi:hypothetical protein
VLLLLLLLQGLAWMGAGEASPAKAAGAGTAGALWQMGRAADGQWGPQGVLRAAGEQGVAAMGGGSGAAAVVVVVEAVMVAGAGVRVGRGAAGAVALLEPPASSRRGVDTVDA